MVALPFPLHAATLLAGDNDDAPASGNAALALAYHQRGVRVFPCREDRFGPSAEHPKGDAEAKKPYPRVMWQGIEPSRCASILRWWQDWPNALIGVGLAERNLVVIDVDGGAAGVEAWETYALEQGGLPDDTPVVITPTDGRHYFFRLPDGVTHGNGRGALPPKAELPVDVRGGKSGYVIASGTERTFHGPYRPDNGDTFAWLDAPVIPDWLLVVLQGKRQHEETAPAQPSSSLPAITAMPALHDHPLVRAYVDKGVHDELNLLASHPEGGRNEQLNKSAFAIAQFVAAGLYPEGQARAALEQAADACGIWKDDGPSQCRKTINSGFAGGMKEPRPIPLSILHEIELEQRGAEIRRTLVVQPDGSLVDEETGEVTDAPNPALQIAGRAFPEHLTYVPGFLGTAIDWIEDTARRPNRAMALGAALALVGTAMGRLWAGPTMSGMHLYTLALAPTGAGKDHPMQQIRRVLVASGMHTCLGAEEFQSSPSVINMVLNRPNCICTMDEFGAFIARINSRRAGGFEMGITKSLRTLWGTNHGIFLTPEWAAKPSVPVFAPSVGIYGASTHDEFFAALDSKQAVNGFLNRFMLLSVETKAAEVEPKLPADVVPEYIIAGMMARFGGGSATGATSQLNPSANVKPFVIPWADEAAKEVYARMVREIERIGDRNPDAVMYLARTAEMAVRLAAIRAAGINALKPAVTVADIEWGRAVAMHSAENMAIMAGKYVADTEAQADAKRIIRIIEEAGGRIRKRELLRKLAHRMKNRDLKDVLDALKESGTITIKQEKPAGGGHIYDVIVQRTD